MLILGSKEKLDACKGLGADVCINYKTEDFVERIKEETNGKGIILPPFCPFVMVDT
jgi:NADPH:quinone reductase-like Zn-dependent oxidoreductase